MESQESPRYIKYKRNTELRHLDPIDVYQLGLRLDENDYWKKLMEIIPKKLDCQRSSEDGQLDWNEAMDLAGAKYNNAHISLIENATKRSDHTKLFTQTLIDEWSTSGRKHERPTVGVLLQLLVKANLFRAADYVAAEFLGEAPPERPLEGPARRISIQLKSEVFSDIKDMVNDSEYYPETEALNQNIIISNSITDNNKDYYTKYKRTEKDLSIIENCNYKPTPPPRHARSSRLKKQQQQQQQQQQQLPDQNLEQNFSSRNGQENVELTTATVTKSTTISNTNGVLEVIQERDYDGTSSEANIPNLQELLHMHNPPAANHTNNSTNIKNETANSSNALTTNTESTELSIGESIPNLSIFLNSSSSIDYVHKEPANDTQAITVSSAKHGQPESLNEILPVISALNVNGEYVDGRSTSPLSERSESNLSKDTSLDDDISYPTDSKEDDDEQNENDNEDGMSMPNLSIFGERQSNNDSSLTSVTGTSGENSFDLSTNESISSASNDENIPCLSILNQ